MNPLSENLRRLRLARGMTQEQAAQHLGVSAQSVSRWETAATMPDVLLLPDIAESDRYGVMSTSSFAATMAIFDALMVALMEEKDYQLSEFALIHPGGAVGKKIN